MRDQDVQALMQKVREGKGLKRAVKDAGFHVRTTLTTLRDTCRDEYKAAKREAPKR